MKGRHVFGEFGRPDRYEIDGQEVTRAQYDAAFPDKPVAEACGDGAGLVAWHRPVLSDGLAVHPEQVPEAMERDRRHGINTQYDAEGRPVLTDRGMRRRLLKSLNMHDGDGGYGD